MVARSQEQFVKKLDEKFRVSLEHKPEGDLRHIMKYPEAYTIVIYDQRIKLVFVTFFRGQYFEPVNLFLKWQDGCFATAPEPSFEPCEEINREEFYRLFQENCK